MVNYKDECQELARCHAEIVVVDSYDDRGIPLFAIRTITKAIGMKSGRNSYWGVAFDEPLSDGSDAVAYGFVLAYSTSYATNDERLKAYHPSWTLTSEDENILIERKHQALKAIDELID